MTAATSTLTRAQCAILFAISCYGKPTERQLLDYVHARAVTLDEAREGMVDLVLHTIVGAIEPQIMSGEDRAYELISFNGPKNLNRARAETLAFVENVHISTIDEVAMRALRMGSLTVHEITARLIEAGFMETEVSDLIQSLPESMFIDDGGEPRLTDDDTIALTPSGRMHLDALGVPSFESE